GATGDDAGTECVFQPIENGLDRPVVDGLDGHPLEARRDRALQLERVGDPAAAPVGNEVESVPSSPPAAGVDPPDQTVRDTQAEAERTVSEERLARNERHRIRPGRVPAPRRDDVPWKAISVATAPARLDPRTDALDRRRQLTDVDVPNHGPHLHTHEYGGV